MFKGKMDQLVYNLYTTRFGMFIHNQFFIPKENDLPHTFIDGPILKFDNGITIYAVPILKDFNYCYVIHDDTDGFCAVVDPADPLVIKKFLEKNKFNLKVILTTHKHWDHAGGNQTLLNEFPNLQIYGTKTDSIYALNKPIKNGDEIKLGKRISIEIIETPCHTSIYLFF